MSSNKNTPEPCFACGKGMQEIGRPVTTRDDDEELGPWVDMECYRRINDAGAAGYQPPQGGPRLWLVGPS